MNEKSAIELFILHTIPNAGMGILKGMASNIFVRLCKMVAFFEICGRMSDYILQF